MLDWIIVGGGPHGVHLAVRLHDELGIDADRIAIVDPAPCLLHTWSRSTARVGMRVLRSTSVHHLDTDPRSLRRLVRDTDRGASLVDPYARPTLALWNEHAGRVIDRVGLRRSHRRAWVRDIRPDHAGVTVITSRGELRSRQVALAPGLAPAHPAWATPDTPGVDHVLADGPAELPRATAMAVIGAGLSGVQAALHLARSAPPDATIDPVTLVSPHDLRIRRFDVDPGWLGPRHLAGFARECSPDRRRALIDQAREVGSIPPEIRHDLDRAVEAGRIRVVRLPDGAVPDGWAPHPTTRGWGLPVGIETVHADRLVLATGLHRSPATTALIETVRAAASRHGAARGSVRVARDRTPIPDPALRWHPRIRVLGGLAELELGPAARNLAGARAGAARIVAAPDPGGQRATTALPWRRTR